MPSAHFPDENGVFWSWKMRCLLVACVLVAACYPVLGEFALRIALSPSLNCKGPGVWLASCRFTAYCGQAEHLTAAKCCEA